jgi:hypothetical protein
MPTADLLSVDDADHRLMPPIYIGTDEEAIALQHLHQRPLAPRYGLSRSALASAYEIVSRRRHQVGAGAVKAATQPPAAPRPST